jgi:hypothetical protein
MWVPQGIAGWELFASKRPISRQNDNENEKSFDLRRTRES